ncbi:MULTISPECIES: penicillin-binding protein 1A [unclassified Thioalkalivibrio]|uniref:penicillin-binding protein 1A n=1 Tax=unclassified Thioalkalivibrio TaxID=2621013 RepID=UPI00037A209A|nr:MULTISPECIES: PBP1A family penicillin-binding protein [unclassified Thioalkalivibrio]
MNPVFKIIAALLALILAAGIGLSIALAALYVYYAPTLPEADAVRDVRLQTPLQVRSADGRLMGEFAEERRIPVPIEAIPQQVRDAFIAAEDERFYDHPGVDVLGLARAALNLVSTGGERSQGGSTITMQLARNIFLTRERTYERKLREIFLAIRLEQELEKDEILELYLNKIYLGQRAYGIEAASRVYFGRSLDALELDEIATLAALPKAPSTTNPVTSPERAEVRRNYVLRRMLETGAIDEAAFEAAISRPVLSERHTAATEIDAHWVAEMARQMVVNLWGDEAYRRGLQVHTTIDSRQQEAANQALREGLLEYDERHGFRGPEMRIPDATLDDAEARERALKAIGAHGRLLFPAVVMNPDDDGVLRVDGGRIGEQEILPEDREWAGSPAFQRGDVIRIRPHTEGRWRLAQKPEVTGAVIAQAPEDGAITALAGGFDFFENRYDRTTQAQRQPGSAFKPLVYALALREGYRPDSTVIDAPMVFNDPALGAEWRPQNYTRRFHGETTLREALANSRNLASIRLLDRLGTGNVHQELTRFGLSRETQPNNLSMVLGTGTLTPLQLNNAYGVFASGGRLNSPWIISRIETVDGEVLYEAATERACPAPCASPEGQDLPLVASSGPLQYTDPVPVLEPGVAWQMGEMLRSVITSGTGRRALELGRSDLAGKTGTTNDYRDAWFAGFNADLVATAWIGFDDNRELGRRESGGRAALPIWTRFMGSVLSDQPDHPLERPDDLVRVAILPNGQRAPSDDAPGATNQWLLPHQIPERGHVIPGGGGDNGGNGSQQPELVF